MAKEYISGKLPRMAERSTDPGAYQPAVRVRNPIIDPGETVEMEVFLTGYGDIVSSKLVIYPSPGVFDPVLSKIVHSIKMNEEGMMTFGAVEDTFDDNGIALILNGGIKANGWPRTTMYFDSHSHDLQLVTEMIQENAPVFLKLNTINSVRPGTYQLQCFFTYNDGHRWNTVVHSSTFVVRNLLQRHEVLIAVIATIAAAVTIAPAIPYLLGIAHCIVQVLGLIHGR
jgi:hypothetical protein